MGITEVQTDIGLFTNNIKKNTYLQFRNLYSTFFLRMNQIIIKVKKYLLLK